MKFAHICQGQMHSLFELCPIEDRHKFAQICQEQMCSLFTIVEDRHEVCSHLSRTDV